ncbi:hypothetical protein EDC04DRAFT_2602246 [Pisolithus marmoratus]|nr:hypothetical protein EDC04DRAFT_2602246 [Pisolithus marmoratus]
MDSKVKWPILDVVGQWIRVGGSAYWLETTRTRPLVLLLRSFEVSIVLSSSESSQVFLYDLSSSVTSQPDSPSAEPGCTSRASPSTGLRNGRAGQTLPPSSAIKRLMHYHGIRLIAQHSPENSCLTIAFCFCLCTKQLLDEPLSMVNNVPKYQDVSIALGAGTHDDIWEWRYEYDWERESAKIRGIVGLGTTSSPPPKTSHLSGIVIPDAFTAEVCQRELLVTCSNFSWSLASADVHEGVATRKDMLDVDVHRIAAVRLERFCLYTTIHARRGFTSHCSQQTDPAMFWVVDARIEKENRDWGVVVMSEGGENFQRGFYSLSKATLDLLKLELKTQT